MHNYFVFTSSGIQLSMKPLGALVHQIENVGKDGFPGDPP